MAPGKVSVMEIPNMNQFQNNRTLPLAEEEGGCLLKHYTTLMKSCNNMMLSAKTEKLFLPPSC